MYTHRMSEFEQDIISIHPGEFYASNDDIVIATVLGSCIAVALHDSRLSQGGLNHFMLPGSGNPRELERSQSARYGMYAMELLINNLMHLGSRRSSLVAKVFGGASVLKLSPKDGGNIADNNIAFIFEYLMREGIAVAAKDVGGTMARKVFLYPQTGMVLLKRLAGNLNRMIESREDEYLANLSQERTGSIILFKS